MAKKAKPLSKVGSSNVYDFSYDRREREMTVTFMRKKGKNVSYTYRDVPPAEVRGLRRARSKGRYMNAIAYDYEFDRT